MQTQETTWESRKVQGSLIWEEKGPREAEKEGRKVPILGSKKEKIRKWGDMHYRLQKDQRTSLFKWFCKTDNNPDGKLSYETLGGLGGGNKNAVETVSHSGGRAEGGGGGQNYGIREGFMNLRGKKGISRRGGKEASGTVQSAGKT